jgi:hypothetical protein
LPIGFGRHDGKKPLRKREIQFEEGGIVGAAREDAEKWNEDGGELRAAGHRKLELREKAGIDKGVVWQGWGARKAHEDVCEIVNGLVEGDGVVRSAYEVGEPGADRIEQIGVIKKCQ